VSAHGAAVRPFPVGRALVVGGARAAHFHAALIGGFGAAIQPVMSTTNQYSPSRVALADIPANALKLYLAAGEKYDLDWAILAAIGSIETDHCRSTAPGVHSGSNSAGAQGCMQFLRSTWNLPGIGRGGDPYTLEDAIPAAARYLVAGGAPADYHAAIFSYNHAEWYVQQVMAKAAAYRGAMKDWPVGDFPVNASAADVLGNPRIILTPIQRNDLRTGLIDPRVVATLAWIGGSHRIIVTALRSDHSRTTVEGNVSNHSFGRAVDIGSVDGAICHGTRSEPCSDLGRELAALHGPTRSTELIWCFDLDGPEDPRGFARADHCNHLHVGWDG
jgi:hypothetical protein